MLRVDEEANPWIVWMSVVIVLRRDPVWGVEIAQRKTFQMVVGPHAQIVGHPLSYALGVVVRYVRRQRSHQRDEKGHDGSRRRNLHFAAAGDTQYRLHRVVEPPRKLVAAHHVVEDDLEWPGRGQAHCGLHHHSNQNKEQAGSVRANQVSKQRDQFDDSND